MEKASEPEPGSVRQKAAIISPVASFGRYFFFCSAVPKRSSPLKPMDECAPSVTVIEPSQPASCCMTRA